LDRNGKTIVPARLIKVINVRIQISRKPSVIVDVATESGCEHYDLVLFAKIGNFVTFKLFLLK
jgi:hypothetical protein